MRLTTLDWSVIAAFFIVTLGIGAAAARGAGRGVGEFFLSGRRMPWWLLGFSMVATTFSTDTPNLVTDIVRQNGVGGNWAWWAFLLTGMLTVFVYARLWRRSGVTTDVEFYELRYSGKAAAFLRGFRALYLGVFFNVCIMATVSLAAIKIGGVMFGFSPTTSILLASAVTVLFSAAGGLTAVVLTDFVLFLAAMAGAVCAAWVALRQPAVGGLAGLLGHEAVAPKLSLVPLSFGRDGQVDWSTLTHLFIMPLAVQWWSVWYPGAEPGGGGYIAQRMLAAKDERHAIGATFFFNAAHYALRPWPWILVALASLIVFPLDTSEERVGARQALASRSLAPQVEQWRRDPGSVDAAMAAQIQRLVLQERGLTAIHAAFPAVPVNKAGHDLAYPAMLTFLPAGLLGLVVASLAAAYMSTISTHLNWGSSYVVNDVWRRFVRPGAGERELIWVARSSTVVLMILAGALALALQNALAAFQILLQIGAGTGLLFILRWFWWRINPYSELSAMAVSFGVAVYFQVGAASGLADWHELLIGVGVTTIAWVAVTLMTPPSDGRTLRSFHRLTQPGGPGWRRVIEDARRDGEDIAGAERGRSNLPRSIVCMMLGCAAVYAALFGAGFGLYGRWSEAVICAAVVAVSATVLVSLLRPHRRAA
ncbi:MAG: Na+:solute symporter [Phycisphaerae bacterium]|nr:MAG: Na+:solute symporter [Planctomycetota bacterium]KAB2950026.1 MAG: Na+:solute symporter [Phycisphaerae bacterium]MBE7458328.1 Na+:solute symporter [Planctomycetia bacterium]MCK6465787.1 Na+:solute symporter [Phycisphaerae bacterium]MCL4719299.1 Na+:solute symporter [Phycisphaerae bacterium]